MQNDIYPAVLSPEEVRSVLNQLSGTPKLLAQVIYGDGPRVMEVCRLRVKDIDSDQSLIFVRSGKGDKDRSTLLPKSIVPALREHLERVRARHTSDLALGHGEVDLPGALTTKPSSRRTPPTAMSHSMMSEQPSGSSRRARSERGWRSAILQRKETPRKSGMWT